ncbi:extracellular solute-binding protein [Acuticoccus sediminis]|uniref:extracellular solute-binding protein n=1 Tax=Acuticoccus sediminis TaxID=2184697 RepID=UPI001CFF2F4B|nr:extracellular solute-binding protein [Acuticoccus sediminis]
MRCRVIGGRTARIRELKPHIAVFWTSGAQQAQLMMDGEVELSTGWNGRFDAAIAAGSPIADSYNQGLLDVDCFGIPKGAPNKDSAMELLAELSRPDYQANLPQYITYGPTNRTAYDLGIIDADLAERLPSFPANAAMQVPLDPE